MIAAGIKRAGRFGAVSLPALWELAQGEAKDAIGTRAKLHALRAARQLWTAAKDREGLKKQLLELGHQDLIAKFEAAER